VNWAADTGNGRAKSQFQVQSPTDDSRRRLFRAYCMGNVSEGCACSWVPNRADLGYRVGGTSAEAQAALSVVCIRDGVVQSRPIAPTVA
jgi:hypothetical protein